MTHIFFTRILTAGLLFLSCLSLSSCSAPLGSALRETRPHNRLVIIDTDLAFDDRLAIFYLLKKPDIRIKAISVSANSPGECLQKIQDLQALLVLSERNQIPTACSSALGLENNSADQPAVTLLTSVLESSSQKITLLAIGPLTNVAEVFKRSPAVIEKIEEIYLMGGAVNVSGNVIISDVGINNPVAEWNFYADPEAANRCFKSKAAITLIPLDATNQVPLTPEFIQRLKTRPQTAQTAYVLTLLTDQAGPMAEGRLYFWDPLAAAILSDQTITVFEKRPLRVIEGNGPKRGQIIIDPAGPEVRVAFRADRERFEQNLIDTIAPLSLGLLN